MTCLVHKRVAQKRSRKFSFDLILPTPISPLRFLSYLTISSSFFYTRFAVSITPNGPDPHLWPRIDDMLTLSKRLGRRLFNGFVEVR